MPKKHDVQASPRKRGCCCHRRAASPHDTKHRASSDPEEASSSDDDDTKFASFTEKRLLSFYEHHLEEEEVDAPRTKALSVQDATSATAILHKPHAYPCADTRRTLPAPPSKWPQRPIMWRPTPHTSTEIRGIRYASCPPGSYQDFDGFCAGCILPINTGREAPGKSLVVDFESNHFVGTILLRVKNVKHVDEIDRSSPTVAAETHKECYFEGKKRTFQCIVKGKFKTPLRMSECVTGQTFQRPAGKLPARWVVTSFIRLVSVLAPQLEASVDSQKPRFLTPLVATAQTVLVKENSDVEKDKAIPLTEPSESMDDNVQSKLYNFKVYPGSDDMESLEEEPVASNHHSLLQTLSFSQHHHDHKSLARRQKTRKKAFNQVFAEKRVAPCFNTTGTEYTFEFYQHLLSFGQDSLSLDVVGNNKINLAPVMDGQPIQIMAAHQHVETGALDTLWSFDLWHEALYERACAAEES